MNDLIKYLKLITEPELPVNKHITFAYFGSVKVSQDVLITHLEKLNKFKLVNPRNDKFGDNNDIPCVVFDIVSFDNKNIDNQNIQNIRKDLLNINEEVAKQNRIEHEWRPHISNLQVSDLEKTEYEVIGVKSNDSLFGIFF
jgi:hypothetical protein